MIMKDVSMEMSERVTELVKNKKILELAQIKRDTGVSGLLDDYDAFGGALGGKKLLAKLVVRPMLESGCCSAQDLLYKLNSTFSEVYSATKSRDKRDNDGEIVSQFDYDIIRELIEMGIEKITKSPEDYDTVLVVGTTGVGKSTLVNYLTDARFKIEKKYNSYLINLDELDQRNRPRIGNDVDSSQTTIPNMWRDDVHRIIFWDCPGFYDIGGSIQEIANALYIKRLFEISQNVKIMMVAEREAISPDSRINPNALVKPLSQLAEVLGVDKLKSAISLVITKVDQSASETLDVKSVRAKLSERLDSLKRVKDCSSQCIRMLQFFISDESRISLFHSPQQYGNSGWWNTVTSFVGGGSQEYKFSAEDREAVFANIASSKPLNNLSVSPIISFAAKFTVDELIKMMQEEFLDYIRGSGLRDLLKNTISKFDSSEYRKLVGKFKNFTDKVLHIANMPCASSLNSSSCSDVCEVAAALVSKMNEGADDKISKFGTDNAIKWGESARFIQLKYDYVDFLRTIKPKACSSDKLYGVMNDVGTTVNDTARNVIGKIVEDTMSYEASSIKGSVGHYITKISNTSLLEKERNEIQDLSLNSFSFLMQYLETKKVNVSAINTVVGDIQALEGKLAGFNAQSPINKAVEDIRKYYVDKINEQEKREKK